MFFCPRLFTAELILIKRKAWKQQDFALMEYWINKLWFMSRMGYYKAEVHFWGTNCGKTDRFKPLHYP